MIQRKGAVMNGDSSEMPMWKAHRDSQPGGGLLGAFDRLHPADHQLLMHVLAGVAVISAIVAVVHFARI